MHPLLGRQQLFLDMLNWKINLRICDEYIIMPNHCHAIIQNTGPVGADLCVCPTMCLPDYVSARMITAMVADRANT